MRFDDMLATVLAQPLETAAARAVAWRQIVDLIAQRRAAAADPARDAAFALLRRLRPELPIDVRAEAARSLAGQRLPPELILLFADEPSAIQRPLVATARLDAGDWLFLLPQLPPVTRGLLRHRRDLPATVARALESFGASDFALGSPAETAPVDAEPTPSAAGEVQIRDLMARIEAFRRVPVAAEDAEPDETGPRIDDFRFETGADGLVLWVDRGPRAALIGVSIAAAADPLDHGVDGHAAGAFRRRAPFRDARLSVAGNGPAAGEWRISAVPFFDPGGGRFTGYRGTARRPRTDESAAPAGGVAGLHGSGLPADSLRQLVHELRTPLNAIVGFAEMIERQLLGPVAEGYRARAADIAGQGRRLLATVDDLDVSARVESHRLALDSGSVDAALLLARLEGDYARSAAQRGVALDVAIGDGVPPVAGDPVAVERMFARLLAATVGLARAGEQVHVRLDGGGEADDPHVAFRVTRPASLAGRDERVLLDPGYSPDGDWPDAPLLGLGFALRLVRSLAAAAGGRLDVDPDAFLLSLPAEIGGALSGSGSR